MTPFPDIASVELFDDGIPHDLLARIRHESPVWIPEPASERFAGGPGYWAVCRHADINEVVQNPQIYSSWLGGTTLREARPQDLDVFRLMMLNTDPPKHSKMRKIVNRAFTPQTMSQLKASIEEHARAVIDAVCEQGEVDFLEKVAAEMPLLVLADILGVPAHDRHLLYDWTNTLVAFDDPDSGMAPETFRAKVLEMFAYASARTLEKRAKPGNDVWSLIVNAEVDGDRLSKGQLDRFFQLLMIAGNETTRNLIAHGMHLLSTHPQQRRKLMADMSLLPAAIEEMLRFSPPVTQFRRTAAVDTELNGRPIKAGDKVLICFAAANRDEAVFDRPDEFDITRKPMPHLSFGGGTHFCLGANLARLEARVLFTELLTRLPDIEVNGPVVRARSSFVNGLLHLPVKFTPASPRGRATRQPAAGLPNPADAHPAIAAAAGAVPAHGTSMLVLYGSNFGTAEDVARKLADDAKGYGFTVNVAELDEYAGQLPEEGCVLIVCATYNGTPPDNARKFVQWVEDSEEPLAKLRYSVFGCGNSDWAATFQEVPRRIDRALSRRGAMRVHAQGEGDAKDDFDGRFEAWVQPMWEKLASELGIELAAPAAEPLFSVEVLKRERVSPFVDSLGARPMPVAQNRELRSREGGGVGSTRHIEFDLPEGVRYMAGDHLGVVPHNARALVERAAARLGFEQDATIRITARSDRKTFLPVGERITLSTLLADYVELQHVATRAQVRTLAAHSRCPFTKMNLEALAADASAGGGEGLYRSEVLAKRRSVLDLLEQFPAAKLPLELYLEMLPPLSPRYYSISSSSLKSERRCSITVGAVSGPAKSGRGEFAGVCSNYLAGQGPGAVLYAFVKDTKSAFRLPPDPRTPIIMVGPGTGLAPFRGFLQERAELRAAGREVGPSMLFFGCRHPQQDYIYRDELEEFARSGVAELHVAFSRLQDRKVYVQDLLREQRERVWALLQRGAVVYVCGDASRMEPDVRAAMVGIAVACG
ncbi:MAG TPA: cytochrome P450, partial [Albitalea sp.]|nr:cytochrome P450 [Albitalea sp.]